MHSRRTDWITTTTFEGAKGQIKCGQISAGYTMQVSSRHKLGRLHKSFTKPPEDVSGSSIFHYILILKDLKQLQYLLFLQNSKNVSIHAIHRSFQLKWTVVAVKHKLFYFNIVFICISLSQKNDYRANYWIIKGLILCGTLHNTVMTSKHKITHYFDIFFIFIKAQGIIFSPVCCL